MRKCLLIGYGMTGRGFPDMQGSKMGECRQKWEVQRACKKGEATDVGVHRKTINHIQPRKNKYRPTLRAVFPPLGLAGPKRTQSSPSPKVR